MNCQMYGCLEILLFSAWSPVRVGVQSLPCGVCGGEGAELRAAGRHLPTPVR